MGVAMQIRPGGVTVVSGPPLSGKSEFATALLCRLTSVAGQADPQRKFRSGLFLLETQVREEGPRNDSRWSCMVRFTNHVLILLDGWWSSPFPLPRVFRGQHFCAWQSL